MPKDAEGKLFVRAESRPIGKTTYFTMRGDSATDIGDGKTLSWDFGTSDDEISAPAGFKRKRLEFQFIDPVNIKEGTIYAFNAPFGAYLDFYVVCPDGEVYLDNNGDPQTAIGDTPVQKFVNHHKINSSFAMGDELNTEAASEEIPINYKFWIDITSSSTDITSQGYISLELYRARTIIL